MEYEIVYYDNEGRRHHMFRETVNEGDDLVIPSRAVLDAAMYKVIHVTPLTPEESESLGESYREFVKYPQTLTEKELADATKTVAELVNTLPSLHEKPAENAPKETLFRGILDFFRRNLAGNPAKWLDSDDLFIIFSGKEYTIHHKTQGIVLTGNDSGIALALLLEINVRMDQNVD